MNGDAPGGSFFNYKSSVVNNLIALIYLIKIPDKILFWLLGRKKLMNCKISSTITKLIYYGTLSKKAISYIYHRSYNNIPTRVVDVVRVLRMENKKSGFRI